ncbi:MAG: hypothetical protein ACRDLB_14255 [Actinomycetota bacterium]
MIAGILVGLLAVAALVVVIQPLRSGPRREDRDDDLLIDAADARKRSALVAIVDMENEHSAGKLTDADLASLRTQYEIEALTALRDLDALATDRDDTELEAEIAHMRDRLICGNCGELRDPGSACPACGA